MKCKWIGNTKILFGFTAALFFMTSCQSTSFQGDGGKNNWQSVRSNDSIFQLQQTALSSCSRTDVTPGFVGLIRLQPTGQEGGRMVPFDSPVAAKWDHNYQKFSLFLLGVFGEELARLDLVQGQPANLQSPYSLPDVMRHQAAGFVQVLEALGPQGLRAIVCGQYALQDMQNVETSASDASIYQFNGNFVVGERKIKVSTQTALASETSDDGDTSLGMVMESELTYGFFNTSVGRVVWGSHLNQNGSSEDARFQVQEVAVVLDDQTIFLWFMEYQ